jgi:hypothetical protein
VLFSLAHYAGIELSRRFNEEKRTVDNKQIFLAFDGELLDTVKKRCALIEKRSITSLLRKLFADAPMDEDRLAELVQKYIIEQRDKKAEASVVNVAVRFPEDEYWKARAKASLARMTVKEFSIVLLDLWVKDKLGEWPSRAAEEKPAGLRSVV